MAKLKEFTDEMPTRVDQFADLLDKNEIVLQRLRNVAAVDEETLLGLGVTGPLLRATGNPWDLRKAAPYSSYDHFDFKIPVGTIGDNYDRYRVPHGRDEGVGEDHRAGARRACPRAPTSRQNRKYALPPRHELATSMEALIHHFKLVTEGFRVPPGEVYYPIESPRGELGCFVRADGSSKPARVHMRDPSFVNLQALKPMVQDLYIADLIATLAMLDPVLGRDRPLDGDRPLTGQALRARLARPGLGRRRRPHEGPGGRPRPRDDARAEGAARRDRGAHGEVPRPALGLDPRAARGPATSTAGARRPRSSRPPA